MPFQIVRNDIVNIQVDAIVNTANPNPVIGYGVDAGVHQKAGPELLEARKKIGKIPVGGAAITPGFGLLARFVIHTVGPVWRGGLFGEKRMLKSCYEKSLQLAYEQGCQSVAFPLISAGNHGFPKTLALEIAMETIGKFLLDHEMEVSLVVFSDGAVRLSEKRFQAVASFIDEHYVQEKNYQQYGAADKCDVRQAQQEAFLEAQRRRREEVLECSEYAGNSFPMPPCQSAAPVEKSAAPRRSLEELLKKTDAGFSETLLKLIDRTGKKDSEIYTRANISRQLFHKIRTNPDYKPTKATAIAFAIALELDLEKTQDLIGRAGYTLTNSSKFDVIIMYFIGKRNYDLYEINATLFEFDQSLLGA